ncbi:MAG: cytosine permease [Bacillota bacterium]|nr:cytosine permease [Bacillota bacterium]
MMTSITDSQSNSIQAKNDYALSRIPKEARRSIFDVSVVAVGFCISMAGLYTGAALSMGLTLQQALIAAVIGNLILSVYGGLVGVAGAREGVSTAMLARHSFGKKGSMFISAIIAVTLVGWFAYQIGFFGITIYTIFPGGGFLSIPFVAGIWGGALMIATAYIGYKGLSVLSKFAAPAILIMSAWGINAAINNAGGWAGLTSIQPTGDVNINGAVVMIVGAFAVGGAIQADITRYSKNATHSIIATTIGYMFAHSFVIIAGYMVTLATGIDSLPAAMVAVGLGIPALIVLIAAQWTTNDNNLYSSSLAFSNILRMKKSKIVLVLGVIATIIGAIGVVDYLVPWLILLGIGVPPVAGIIIADYFIIKKGKYEFERNTAYGDFSKPAFISWIIAAIAGYNITWGLSSINSLVIGFVVYIFLMKIFETSNIAVFSNHEEDKSFEVDFQ